MSISKISSALSARFVKSEKVAEALALGYAMSKPVLLWGWGGHGKSKMVRAAFGAMGFDEPFILSFGEGMTESELYGGLDLAALNREDSPKMQYFPENSFLNSEAVLFEELFDAPPSVLLSLKDTLTSKCLNKGGQRFPMRTRWLVAATNKTPAEIGELSPSCQALIERFPLQLEVKWDSYEPKDFLALFEIVEANLPDGVTILSSSLRGLLAQLIADANASGEWISPRQSVVALDAVKAWATMHGRSTPTEEDLVGIKFIPGTEAILEGIAEKIATAKRVETARATINSFFARYTRACSELNGNHAPMTPIRALKALKLAKALEKDVSAFSVPDELVNDRKGLLSSIADLIKSANDRALDLTNV